MTEIETFGGYNEDGPKKDKKLHRSRRTILDPIRCQNQTVPLIKNGHTSTIGIPRIASQYTCGFDSILFIYAVAYADYPSIENDINQSSKSGTFEELIKLLFVEKENIILNKRNVLLERLYNDTDANFVKKITDRLIQINCECAFDFLNRKLNEISEMVYSVCEKKNCESCKSIQSQRFLRFIPIIPELFDIHNIQSSIQILTTTIEECSQCNTALKKERTLNKIIVVDIDNPVPDVIQLREHMHVPLPLFSIDEVTQKISVDGEDFHLHAVLCHSEKVSHFYAKVKRPNGNWELYDDLLQSAKIVKTNEIDSMQALFFVSGKSYNLS